MNEAENGLGSVDLPTCTLLVTIGALMALILLFRPQGITGGREFSLSWKLPRPRPPGQPLQTSQGEGS